MAKKCESEIDPSNAAWLPETESSPAVIRLVVIMTCFNRKQKTLECLHALAANKNLERVQLAAVLVDDGSTDGTAQAVREAFPWVQIVATDNLFWCRGMHKAFAVAMEGHYDYYLWLNDDTILHADAVARLLECESALRHRQRRHVIVVGSTSDAETGAVTYGGDILASKFRRTTFRRVLPGAEPQRCDSMTGNIVLIPSAVADIVGNLDPVFEHAMGDTDYAFRARELGVEVWVGAGIFGVCGHNPVAGTYLDVSLPLSRRWKLIMSRKGLPWRSWLVLTFRHAGILWPLYFGWPYIKLIVNGYRRRAYNTALNQTSGRQ